MKNKVFPLLIVIFFLLGIFCLSFPLLKDYFVLKKVITSVEIKALPPLSITLSDKDYQAIKPPSDYELMTAKIPQEAAVARLVSKASGLNVAVYREMIQKNLLTGVAPFFQERELGIGNTVLLGHHVPNKTALFSPLTRVKTGEKMYLQLADKLQVYKVTDRKIISEQDLTMITENSGTMLTLITCDTFNQTNKRLVIRAILMRETTKTDGKVNKKEPIWKQYDNELKQLTKTQTKEITNYHLLFIGLAAVLFIVLIGWILYYRK